MIKGGVVLAVISGMIATFAAVTMAAAPPDKDLVLRYTFDDFRGNTVLDTTKKLDGKVEGAVVQTAGVNGKAMLFDGDSNFVLVPEKALDKLTEFSISVWARVDEKRMWSRIWDFGTGANNNLFVTPYSGSWSVMAEVKPDGTNMPVHRCPSYDLDWHHTTITYKAKTLRIFVDGKEAGWNTFPDDFTPNIEAWWQMEQNFIGKSQYPDPLFKGAMDEFRIYKRALTADEVASLATK